ncbi:DUF4312 family protein [Enterococcus sp. AZ072]|uniref:DUF4312 family protein n=1 Tax=unclassified Enterococcus TaxID=2608891 RepID=UPI003D2CAE1C
MNTTEKKQQIITVNGRGETKAAAFSDALNQVQKQVLKGTSDVILRIEPKSVTVLSAEEQKYTERFLFFFFPRERVNYSVKLDVEVELLMIDMASVPFEPVAQAAPDAVNVPFLSKKV